MWHFSWGNSELMEHIWTRGKRKKYIKNMTKVFLFFLTPLCNSQEHFSCTQWASTKAKEDEDSVINVPVPPRLKICTVDA